MNEQPLLLLVDDEPAVLNSLRRVFRSEPYEVRTADSAQAALDIFASGVPVRVVISDYRMPLMNGVEFLKEVFERSPETVRIILSGFADRPVLLAAVQEGRIYKFLPKPWDDNLLTSTVRKGIEQSAEAWEKREHIESLLAENTLLQTRSGIPTDGVADRDDFVQRMIRVMTGNGESRDPGGPGIICVGSDGGILLCNETAAARFKSAPQRLIGRPAEEALGRGVATFIDSLLASDQGGTHYYQEEGMVMSGTRFTYLNGDYAALIFI